MLYYYNVICLYQERSIMVNEERTKLMTKAEIFRVKEERNALRRNRFYKGDYIAYEMIRSAIAFIFAFALLFVMWVLYYAEPLMTQRSVEELAGLMARAGGSACCACSSVFWWRHIMYSSGSIFWRAIKMKEYQRFSDRSGGCMKRRPKRSGENRRDLRNDDTSGPAGTN